MKILEHLKIDKTLIPFIGLMVLFITAANFAVKYKVIEGMYITYTVFAYPLTFILTNFVIEKYNENKAFKVLLWSVPLAVVPSYFVNLGHAAALGIAIGSLLGFIIAQVFDILIFKRFYRLGLPNWAPMIVVPILALGVDNAIFYYVGLSFVDEDWWKIGLSDWAVKSFMSIVFTAMLLHFVGEWYKYQIGAKLTWENVKDKLKGSRK